MGFSIFFVTLLPKWIYMQENLEISKYKKSLRGRIPDVAMKLFLKNGIHSVRMDDVAKEMGISKRTIYEIYDNKESLLFEVVVAHFKRRLDNMEYVLRKCSNVMEILLEVYRMKVTDFKTTNPLFFTEMVRLDIPILCATSSILTFLMPCSANNIIATSGILSRRSSLYLETLKFSCIIIHFGAKIQKKTKKKNVFH